MNDQLTAINAFIARERIQEVAERSTFESLQYFSYDHDVITKMILVFAAVIGVAIMKYGFSFASRFFQVVTAGVGGLVTLAALLAFYVIGIIAPHPFAMATHQFKEGSHGAAKLYYQGQIPILEVTYEEGKRQQAGFDQGYLMGASINAIVSRLDALYWVAGMPKSHRLEAVLRKVSSTIPEEYQEELRGLVDGYNAWVDTQWISHKKITYNDILLLHLIPDRVASLLGRWNAFYGRQERAVQHVREPVTGCTTIMMKGRKKGAMMMRTLDWDSAAVLGINTLIRNSKFKDGKPPTVEIGFPGLIGSLTGMKPSGFTVAMNVCAKQAKWVDGMPAVFYNRMILESCNSVKEAEKKVAANPPLGPYHLMVMDKAKGRAFHFYQGRDRAHTSRTLQGDEPLVVTNGSYDEEARHSYPMFYSLEREAIINKLRREIPTLTPQEFLETCPKLPYVNNPLTTLVAHIEPKAKRVKLAWQNAFAGSLEPIELDTAPLFRMPSGIDRK